MTEPTEPHGRRETDEVGLARGKASNAVNDGTGTRADSPAQRQDRSEHDRSKVSAMASSTTPTEKRNGSRRPSPVPRAQGGAEATSVSSASGADHVPAGTEEAAPTSAESPIGEASVDKPGPPDEAPAPTAAESAMLPPPWQRVPRNGSVLRDGVDRDGVGRDEVDRAGVDRAGVNRAGVDRAGADPDDADQETATDGLLRSFTESPTVVVPTVSKTGPSGGPGTKNPGLSSAPTVSLDAAGSAERPTRDRAARESTTGGGSPGRPSRSAEQDGLSGFGRPAAGPTSWPRSRRPRQASLQLKRLDPWSVLKVALVLAVALYLVWLVAVGVLYGVLDGIGVWDRLNGQYADLVAQQGGDRLISAGRVFGVAAVIGAVNSLLLAVAISVAAFVYNVAADLVGGIEVTLSERD